ncbi:MAG: hypothetical protein IT355_08030 [Gemmatimonadaceae bacterium]|nr:hypothetical protein [Gemmatimonadaceae bacterium]
MSTRLLVLVTAALLTLAGCGDGAPTDPATPRVTMKIAPDSTTLSRSQRKVFRASAVSGSVPAGGRLVWAVLGSGTLSGAAGDSVTYVAPAADGVDTLTVQVLDASSTPVGGGATPVRTASGTALAVAISPVSPHVESQTGAGTQLLVVTPTTGTIPVGGSYRWTITGAGATTGLFSGSSATTATTTVNNATYVSPAGATTDTVRVEVRNASGAVVAMASTPVLVFPGLVWANTGANTLWAQNNYGNGAYTSPGGGLGRVDLNAGTGAEQVSCVYQNLFPVRLSTFLQFNVTLYAPRNVRVKAGDVFVQGATPATTPGALSMPQVSGVNSITLTVSSVLTQSDGADFLTFSFTTAGNAAGYTGTMSGTGQCVVRYPF